MIGDVRMRHLSSKTQDTYLLCTSSPGFLIARPIEPPDHRCYQLCLVDPGKPLQRPAPTATLDAAEKTGRSRLPNY